MERYILVAQLDPTQASAACYCLVSRIKRSDTRDNNFVKWRGTFWFDRPNDQSPVKVDHLQGWSQIFPSDQTKMDHSIWSTNWNFRNFGLNGNKAPLGSSLRRILRFTPRLHAAYLPNYFQLCLLKFCHTVDQFDKWTSPKTVENKHPCGVQCHLTV